MLTDPAAWQAKREVLHQRCAEVGRDPAEIETSINLRLEPDADPATLQPLVEAWQDAGVDICIVYVSPPHRASVVGPLAEALGPLT